MKITIVDIAKMSGVSQATVSRVLNNPEQVKKSTRDRILRVMKERNYVYNALAGGLSKNKTRTLGLIIPTITNPIFAVSTKGIQTAAAQRGYSILLGSTEYSDEYEFNIVRLFLEKRVDGVILTGSPLNDGSINYMQERNMPFVVTWEMIQNNTASFVTFDNVKSSRQVVDYLVSMGHRSIGMISGRFSDTGRARRRWEGYKQGLKQWDLPYDERFVIQTDYTVVAGREAGTRLLQHPTPPTAIFCGNDILAYGVMAAIKDRGLKVGGDISIVGFDDLEMSAAMDPPLTTIRIPGHKMGKMAADTLIDTIEGKNKEVIQYVLETDFIVRNSVSSLNRDSRP